MRVLKFGGTSVANAYNMGLVADIIINSLQKEDTLIVVLSALGGITDALLEAASLASKGDEAYKEVLHSIEQRHLFAVKELFRLISKAAF